MGCTLDLVDPRRDWRRRAVVRRTRGDGPEEEIGIVDVCVGTVLTTREAFPDTRGVLEARARAFGVGSTASPS